MRMVFLNRYPLNPYGYGRIAPRVPYQIQPPNQVFYPNPFETQRPSVYPKPIRIQNPSVYPRPVGIQNPSVYPRPVGNPNPTGYTSSVVNRNPIEVENQILTENQNPIENQNSIENQQLQQNTQQVQQTNNPPEDPQKQTENVEISIQVNTPVDSNPEDISLNDEPEIEEPANDEEQIGRLLKNFSENDEQSTNDDYYVLEDDHYDTLMGIMEHLRDISDRQGKNEKKDQDFDYEQLPLSEANLGGTFEFVTPKYVAKVVLSSLPSDQNLPKIGYENKGEASHDNAGNEDYPDQGLDVNPLATPEQENNNTQQGVQQITSNVQPPVQSNPSESNYEPSFAEPSVQNQVRIPTQDVGLETPDVEENLKGEDEIMEPANSNNIAYSYSSFVPNYLPAPQRQPGNYLGKYGFD